MPVVESPLPGIVKGMEERSERQLDALRAIVNQIEAQGEEGTKALRWAKVAGIAGVAAVIVGVLAIILAG